jgi:HK97 family phage major capsid protein
MATNSLTDRTDAGALIPEDASSEIIKNIYERSAVLQLARRRPNMTRAQQRIPVLDTLPIAYFVNGDTGLKQTTDAAWTNVYLNAEEVAVIVPVPENVIADTDYDLVAELMPDIVTAFDVAISQAIVFGTNKPASWPTSIRAGAAAASNNVALGTGADIYDDILGENGTFGKVEADGFQVTGSIAATNMKAKLRGLRDANGQPIFMSNLQDRSRYELDGTPIYFPNNGEFDATSTYMVSGDWSQLIYAIRQDMNMKLATEGVITDNAKNIIYNLFQQDMVAYRFTMRMAFALPNPTNRINPTAGTRYPFSALTT